MTPCRGCWTMSVPNHAGLVAYFQWLSGQLAQRRALSESELERAVEIPPFRLRGVRTLLEVLGYDDSKVRKQYPIQMGTRTYWVDYLVQADGGRWMLDLKASSED